MGSLFVEQDGKLIELKEKQLTEADGLQTWIANHAELLPGGDIDPASPRRFLLVRREAPVGENSLDHLFVDQDATPTFIEAKRASNRELRRLVVGQMLDYAAQASGAWSAETLSGWLAARCEAEQLNPEGELDGLDHSFDDAAAFWRRAEENLRSGDVRLIFLADEIPNSLARVVEFLNERMKPTEVLAVEVKRREANGTYLYSTDLVGQTEKAREIKGKSPRRAAITELIAHGEIKPGQVLWLRRDVLPTNLRPENPDDPRLRFTLELEGSQPLLRWNPAEGVEDVVVPSKAPDHVRQLLDPGYETIRARAVNDAFSLQPGGQSLGELAVETGAWE